MRFKDFIQQLDCIQVNELAVRVLNDHFQCELPLEAQKVVSFQTEGFFFDDSIGYHLLSLKQILQASQELLVDFQVIKLIPLIDISSNDFICFDHAKNAWCVYNIVDEARFLYAQHIGEYQAWI
ncbi:MAG TPA: hypothetical protein PKJ34_13345 [Anaerolineaceae bacterium]|nr:hypothetical protein [Anaerolineaceae bacterium]HOH21339.1 hypothetical protein [Anaerolineaceae bacterium]HPA33879.1 hypothetical protein [Anaerolineaceae bacterium]HQO98627.1 hypothetical protein [Anaerolineaceae bacterium]HQP61829.1 hypothetical protein [Anaerolineaceae bacterium]